ncbi:hypothetical protein RND71_043258 [Anisodus tanguticus]|uniref:Uncharacterized protein n=1 Tax=Anisodus tanguticus TaxID=243964 RepID=A0AAE1UT39_9SOLA|nr:hypothetical protein RND71_043258 [Anisodus tanguticus]
MAASVGKPISIDSATRNKTRPSSARVKISDAGNPTESLAAPKPHRNPRLRRQPHRNPTGTLPVRASPPAPKP